MNRGVGAQYSSAEREALDRVLTTFPATEVGELIPHEDDRPDVVVPGLEPVPLPPQMLDGLSFALGGSSGDPAIWGRGDDVAWSSGEAVGIVGPDGVGKSTLVHRLAMCLVGISDELLGMNVEPAEGRVLLVAADRPKQAARSLWRMCSDGNPRNAARLREGLLVWRGPVPFDVVKNPDELATWAVSFGASHVLLDSLGFIFPRLSDDETGAAIAQAFMASSVAGIELLWLGHPRKATADNRKPSAISDVYGSRWITAASGSVLSLWANPGDPVGELRQLKSPSGEVGPFLFELDHERGTMTVLEGTDLLGHLRTARAGLTTKDASRLMEGATERAREVKARRRLEGLVGRGLAYRREGEPIRGGVHEPDRYFATLPPGLQEEAG